MLDQGREPGHAQFGLQTNIVPGVGQNEVQFALGDGPIQVGIVEHMEAELGLGDRLGQIVGRGLPARRSGIVILESQHPDGVGGGLLACRDEHRRGSEQKRKQQEKGPRP